MINNIPPKLIASRTKRGKLFITPAKAEILARVFEGSENLLI